MKKEWRVVITAVIAFLCFALAIVFLRKNGQGNGAGAPETQAESRTSTQAQSLGVSPRQGGTLPWTRANAADREMSAWDLPIAPSVWFGIVEAFPYADYTPWEETADEFCNRVHDADHRVYTDGKTITVDRLTRMEQDDGTWSCSTDSILSIETITTATIADEPCSYIVASKIGSGVYEGEQKEIPFFEIDSDDASLGDVLVAARDWTETLQWARGQEYNDAEDMEVKIRAMESHMKAYDMLMHGEHTEIIQLRVDVRAVLQGEAVDLNEKLVDAWVEEQQE